MPHTPESHKHLTKDYNSSRKLISEPSQSNARAADVELTHSGCDKTGSLLAPEYKEEIPKEE